MKTFYLLLLLIFCIAYSNNSCGQTIEKIQVPVLKDGKKIDDLLDIILKQKKRNTQSENKFQADSSLVIYILKFKDYVSFGIAEKSNAVMNGIINKMFFYKANFGCFQYHQKNIFVWTKDQFYDFLVKTSDTRELDFIFKIGSYKQPADEQIINWHYKYQDGHFSIEGPPSVAD